MVVLEAAVLSSIFLVEFPVFYLLMILSCSCWSTVTWSFLAGGSKTARSQLAGLVEFPVEGASLEGWSGARGVSPG